MYILKRGNKIFKTDNKIYGYKGTSPDTLNKAYGVVYDSNNPNTALQRIGNLSKHVSLPVQSQMRRCILKDDGTVNYYLADNDSNFKEDGVTPALLDGTDGQVMVEIPAHWQFFKKEGALDYGYISDEEIEGFEYVPKSYYGAFWGMNESSKLTSRAGVVPTQNQSRTSFRNLANARGSANWCIDNYYQRRIWFWLYLIEYANSNSQDAVVSTLSPEGYKQGGLGAGVTEYWPGAPYVTNGLTAELGNWTGEIDWNYAGRNIKVNSYRGIEQPFGHLDSWADGINIKNKPNADGGKLEVWVCSNPLDFSDISYTGYDYVGNMNRGIIYIRRIIGNGHFICSDEAGSGNEYSYMCDRSQGTDVPGTETMMGVRCGGYANVGAACGLASAFAYSAPSIASAYIGSRLCYLP